METVYSSDNKTETIVDVLIAKFALKNDLLLFCGVFECLFGSKTKIDVIDTLRDGKENTCYFIADCYCYK